MLYVIPFATPVGFPTSSEVTIRLAPDITKTQLCGTNFVILLNKEACIQISSVRHDANSDFSTSLMEGM